VLVFQSRYHIDETVLSANYSQDINTHTNSFSLLIIMGTASKVCSVILRLIEMASAAIVVGILGRYLSILADANVDAGTRIIYSEVIAGISLFFSIILLPPLRYSFYFFALDFSLFVCWIVAFALLCNVSRTEFQGPEALFVTSKVLT
jgi:hypothetical protein